MEKLRFIKAWDMQFCVKNVVILNSLYLEKSLRYTVYAKVTGSPYILSENGILYYVYGG